MDRWGKSAMMMIEELVSARKRIKEEGEEVESNNEVTTETSRDNENEITTAHGSAIRRVAILE